MKNSPVFLILGLLLLTSCGSRDNKISRQITGTWTTDDGVDVWTLSADGGFDERWSRPPRAFTFQGTWEVKNGMLIQTITKIASTNISHLAPIGTVNRSKIVEVSRTNLTLTLEGQTNQLVRQR